MAIYHEIFDKANAGERGRDIDVEQVARDYDPTKVAAPAIIGHSTSYPADTRIPVGAWVEGLKAEGTKLFAAFKSPEEITVTVPAMFKELADMPKFFKQAVNGKMYAKHSAAFLPTEDGKHQFHHIAFLGAALPECKGMPDIVFAEHPDFKLRTIDFSSSANIIEFTEEDHPMTINLLKVIEFAGKGTKDQLKQFTELDLAKLTEQDLQALTDIVPLLKEILGLNDTATVSEVLGGLKVCEADFKKCQESLAAIGAAAMTPGTTVSTWAEEAKKLVEPMMAEFAEQKKVIAEMTAKIKQFAETPPATPPAPATPAATELKIETLGKSDEDCQKAFDTAKQTLVDKKAWIPAYDNTVAPVMKICANIKMGEGSALDQLVNGLGAVEGLVEMNQLSERYKLIELSEKSKLYNQNKSPDQPMMVPKGIEVGNLDARNKIVEFAKKEGKPFEEAMAILISRGEVTVE